MSTSTKKTINLIDSDVHSLALRLDLIATARKGYEKEEEKLKEKLREKMGPYLDEYPDRSKFGMSNGVEDAPVEEIEVRRGTHTSIDREVLLRGGVEPELLEKATKRTEYLSLTVKRADV